MGLSFHYSGSFNKHASLQLMVEEVKDIAETFKWKYHIYEDKFPQTGFAEPTFTENVYGISFTLVNCETVWLCFLSNGRMSSPMHLQFYGKSEDKAEQQYLYMLAVKTQFAGIEIHKILIQLFKYLEKKYLDNFTMLDEGKYWETGDEKLLEETFKLYTDLLDNFVSAIESYPKKAGETFESYFERLMQQIHLRNKE